jgi:hypothetical protein
VSSIGGLLPYVGTVYSVSRKTAASPENGQINPGRGTGF